MSAPKVVLLIVWLLCIVSFFLPADFTSASLGRAVFWLMGIAHVIECIAFRKVLESAPGTLGHNLVQTLIFGVLHIREVRDATGSTGGDD